MEQGFLFPGQNGRGIITEIHIADLHFGAFDPSKQYKILQEQFISRIAPFSFDILSIDGDIFDHKMMANSDSVMYASKFVDDCVRLCREKGATITLISGTMSHDFDQLKLFYHYIQDPTVDIRIANNLQFEIIKGARILMIPEMNGLEESVYQQFFFHSGWYDEAFVHGTFEGAVYGNMTTGQSRLLSAKDFIYCRGPVISGHVHKPGCFQGFYYYCGSPYRWKFGEEEDKGFIIVAHDLDTHLSYIDFEPIKSFRYDTIYLDELVSDDPKKIIDYINEKKITEGIDYIKVKFRVPVPGYNQTIINNYYRNNSTTFIEFEQQNTEVEIQKQKQQEMNTKYDYLTNSNMTDFEKFVKFVNDSEGYQFITVEKLTALLKEKD